MRKPLHDTEWDGARLAHDRDASAPAMPGACSPRPHGHNGWAKRWLMPALVCFAVPLPSRLLSDDGAIQGVPWEALFSFAPTKTTLPSLEASIARLAAESANATCWVLKLRPHVEGCVAVDVAR